MAIDLVTVDEAMAHLRLDTEADEAWLEIFIPAVSEAVSLWLKDEWRLYEPSLDSNGDVIEDSSGDPIPALDDEDLPTARSVVRAAVLVELASQYRFREGEGQENVVTPDAGHGYTLNKASTALLSGLRKTTLK